MLAGTALISTSAYHSASGIPFEAYNLTGLSWAKPLNNYDNVGTASWVLLQVR